MNITYKFERFWLDEVKQNKPGSDGHNHNKLRTYSLLKGSFQPEPYILSVRNRNQRSFLTRLRTSSHQLAVETGRYKKTVIPFKDRVCVYCQDQSHTGCPQKSIDTEFHFLMECQTFKLKRNCLFGKISSLKPNFKNLTKNEQFATLLCPTTPQLAKLSNKFIKILFECRKKISEGATIEDLNSRQTDHNLSITSDASE